MIFALATDSLELLVFSNESDAVAYAEGVDVEDGAWLFFSDAGKLLEPVFSVPNDRGRFSVQSGKYYLVEEKAASINLMDMLPTVSAVQGNAPYDNIESVKQLLTFNSTVTPGGARQ